MSEETRRQERTPVLQMVVVGAIASLVGIVWGIAIDWFPTQASTQAKPIDDLYDLLIIVSVPVFVLVTVIVLFCAWKFHVRPGEENLDGPPIHGNTKLEVIWTAIPAIVLVALCSWSYVVLTDIEEAQANEMRIDVTGPAVRVDLRVPAGRRQADPLDDAVPRRGPSGALQRQGARRPARLLGAGLPHEDRRGPGHHDALPHHAQPARHVPRRLRGAVRARALGHALDGEGRHARGLRRLDGGAEGAAAPARRPRAHRRGRGAGGGGAAAAGSTPRRSSPRATAPRPRAAPATRWPTRTRARRPARTSTTS